MANKNQSSSSENIRPSLSKNDRPWIISARMERRMNGFIGEWEKQRDRLKAKTKMGQITKNGSSIPKYNTK